MASQSRHRLLTFNDPHPMRIDRDLAAEIGLNESILLLQIEYLISISSNERDGRLWTYQSLTSLQETYFPWWSVMTISRIVKSLEEKQLIIIGNFNKLGYDRTQWFALNEEGINLLHSIAIYQNDKCISQNGTSIYQFDGIDPNKMLNGTQQNVTTIPESTQRVPESLMSEKRPRKGAARAPTQNTLDSFHEAVTIYKQCTNKSPPPTTASLIAATVIDMAAWQAAVKAWCDRGFKPGNVEGMIDWYLHPEKQQRGAGNGNKHLRQSISGDRERGVITETDLDRGF